MYDETKAGAPTLRVRDPDELLKEAQSAQILNVSVRTLQGWRLRRSDGPPFVRCGVAVRYRWGDLQAWIQRQTVQSTSQDQM